MILYVPDLLGFHDTVGEVVGMTGDDSSCAEFILYSWERL